VLWVTKRSKERSRREKGGPMNSLMAEIIEAVYACMSSIRIMNEAPVLGARKN
jgi:hypothetical protein